jgi:glutathione S-transferase
MTIILYDLCARDQASRFSPHCWKVKMALAHKGIPYETRPTPFSKIKEIGGGFSRTVPVIDDGGHLVRESFDIAVYLEEKYPDRPTLFAGEGGRAEARFIESWQIITLHPPLFNMIVTDIHARLGDSDQELFRATREKFFGKKLEEMSAGREERIAAYRESLAPIRLTLKRQPFIGGQSPLFADYILFGAFQWARIMSPFPILAEDDPIKAWVERCLDLHGGLARQMPAAA